MGLLPIIALFCWPDFWRFWPFAKGTHASKSCTVDKKRRIKRINRVLLGLKNAEEAWTPVHLSQWCLVVKRALCRHLPQSLELEALCHYHHPSPSPLPLSPHRCLEEGVEEVGSLGGAAEAGEHREVEVGCLEEEAEMGTRGTMRQAEEALLGLRKEKVLLKDSINTWHTWQHSTLGNSSNNRGNWPVATTPDMGVFGSDWSGICVSVPWLLFVSSQLSSLFGNSHWEAPVRSFT